MKTVRSTGLFLLFIIGVSLSPAHAGALAIHESGGIQYVSGGVGQDERNELKSLEDRFNLRLMFAAQGGAFLSDVQVTLLDGGGKTILDAVSEGPFFYARLPQGAYTVIAAASGQSKRRAVNVVATRLARADFFWH